MSASPPEADIASRAADVRKVPTTEVAKVAQNKKPPEGGLCILDPMIVDQATINAGFDFRR